MGSGKGELQTCIFAWKEINKSEEREEEGGENGRKRGKE